MKHKGRGKDRNNVKGKDKDKGKHHQEVNVMVNLMVNKSLILTIYKLIKIDSNTIMLNNWIKQLNIRQNK